MKSVCIIGGGASALMCACFVSDNIDVTIIEQNEKIGKKILATGNGRCNLSNRYMNKCSYNCDISKYLTQFNNIDTLKFFNKIGLETYEDEQGRVYPLSNSANSVLEVLKNHISQKPNVHIVTCSTFTNLSVWNGGFNVFYENSQHFFDKVVVASGNKTDLSIYKNLGVEVIDFLPSLCALKTEKNKVLAGHRFSDVKVTCKRANFQECGEVLFREDGISGIVIFNLSSYLARINNYCVDIVIDFLPNITIEKLIEKLKNRQKLLKKYKIDDFLTGFLDKSLNFEILKQVKLDLNKSVNGLTIHQIEMLAHLIKNYKISTCGYLNNNQVCTNGVLLECLDDNLQSKKVKGLYFAGEVINVDGVCGGYNLQWAWTSGKIVGESL